MEAEDVLDDVIRFAGEGGEGTIVDDEDGDALAAVDGIANFGLDQQVTESWEFRVFAEDVGDV